MSVEYIRKAILTLPLIFEKNYLFFCQDSKDDNDDVNQNGSENKSGTNKLVESL